MICSYEVVLEKETNHLRIVFTEINDYSTRVVNNVIKDELEKLNISNNESNSNKIVANQNKIK